MKNRVFCHIKKMSNMCFSNIHHIKKRVSSTYFSLSCRDRDREVSYEEKGKKKHFKITDGFHHQMLHFNLGRNALLRT